MADKFGLPTPQHVIGVDTMPVTITGAAAVVPVSGSPLAVSQSGSWSVTASGTVTATPPADTDVTGTIAALSASKNTGDMNGIGAVVLQITGTWVGTINFWGSVDGSSILGIAGFPNAATAGVTSTTTNGSWIFSAAGWRLVGVIFNAYTSGTANIRFRLSYATPAFR